MQAVIELNNSTISFDLIPNGFTDQWIKKLPKVQGWDIIPKAWPEKASYNQHSVNTHRQA